MKSELTVMKVRCDESMIGQDIMIPATPKSAETLKSLPYAKKMQFNAKYSDRHNLERHDLFWACVGLVSENLGKNELQIEETCKIDCRWIKGYTAYTDKNGKPRVNVITKSISFSSMTLEDADKFYAVAFDMLASYINVPIEIMIDEAKKRMKQIYFCFICGKRSTEFHHCFSKTKWAIEKYGRELIDHELNKIPICNGCNGSHANIPKKFKWSEKVFIKIMKNKGLLK